MSETRKIKKGKIKGKVEAKRRNLTITELKEYLQLIQVCNVQHWKTGQIKTNTALIPNGQEVAKTEEAISRLFENSKNNWLSVVLLECGVPVGQSVNINSETGEIVDAVAKK